MTPDGLKTKFAFGSKEHGTLLSAVRDRLRMSEQKMRTRYAQMARNEERFQAYVPESTVDALRRVRRENSGQMSYRTIEIPYSYAVLMTAHTYYTNVFLSRNPVFQIAGRHGEPEMNVQAIEAVLDYQRQVGEMMVPLFIWLLDPGKYGFGVVGHYWDEQYVNCREVIDVPVTFLGIPVPGKFQKKEQLKKIPGFRGNKIYNVRPQDCFPDVRVPLRYFQRGEFFGRYVENSWFEVVQGERDGRYFNIGQLRKMRASKDQNEGSDMISRDRGSDKVGELPEGPRTESLHIPTGSIRSYELYVRAFPNEWGFGPEKEAEIWVITVSANGIIYGVEPLGEYSDAYPFDIIEHEPEGYSLFSRSMLEISQPLSDVISWLVNSHFYNVRAALNNQFLIDPSAVVMKDFQNPDPGKLLRLKPEAYGRDVRTILTQLPVADVTRGHIGDVQMVGDFIQRVLGVSDSAMGVLPQKSHTTATAVRTSTNFGLNRMKTNCEYYSAMGWSPFVQKLIQRTQQNMDFEMTLRVAGDLSQFGTPWVKVDPAKVAGFYDYIPVDGTMPIDRFAQANLWQMLLGQLQKFPQITATYDIAKIFAWVSSLAGIKNIAQFRITPDAMLRQQAASGNVVPLGAAMQDTGIGTNLNEPRQLPGVGATG